MMLTPHHLFSIPLLPPATSICMPVHCSLQVEAAQNAQSWTNGMLDFHRVLSNLSEVVSEHAKRRHSASSSSDDSDSDVEEASDASGGKASAQRRQTQAPTAAKPAAVEAAAARPESKREKKRRRGDGGGDDGGGAAQPRVRAATHIGRFKKREAAKMVKGYSQTDLAAILGGDPFAATAAAIAEVRRAPSSSGYESDASSEDDKSEAEGAPAVPAAAVEVQACAPAQQQQQQQDAHLVGKPPRPEMIVVRRAMVSKGPPPPPAPAPQEGPRPGWWHMCFKRAVGPAGVGAGPASAAINIHGFSEEDQTNLYHLAHVSIGS
jgi:hypothetical protein